MHSSAFTVRETTWAHDQHALQAVRLPVFVIEQKVDAREEFDDIDLMCAHILAVDSNDIPIGTGRIDSHGKIGRMAVLLSWRKQSVGNAILDKAIAIARAKKIPRVYLHAQSSALGFYEGAGFVAFGDRFYEAGIEHQAMQMSL